MATDTVNLVPESLEGDPILTRGDSEFWGEPNFRARIWLEHRDKVIYVRADARWEEPKGDFTTFRMTTRRAIFDIRSKKGPSWYFVNFKDQYDLDLSDGIRIPGTNRGLQEIYRSNSGLVSAIYAEGDSWKGPFGGGDDPKVRIEFNRVYFDVSDH